MQQTTVALRTDPTKVVRRIWGDFETWAAEQRTNLEKECSTLDNKWRSTSLWTRSKGNNESQKATEVRTLQEKYISTVRQEWDKRLRAHKLKDADWGAMTPQEQERVFIVLGGDLDESSPVGEGVVTHTTLRPQPSSSSTSTPPFSSPAPPHPLPPVTVTVAAAPIQIPASAMAVGTTSFPAPILSATARTLNSSTTSSYSFVDPADFTTDDELYEAASSYITLPTDESDNDEPVAIKDPDLWGISSQENHNLSSSSIESRSVDHMTPEDRHFNLRLEDKSSSKQPLNTNKTAKPRLRGPSYVGPLLSDSDETSEDEADFERFKMETRIMKIWEFHYAAAQADVQLAINIYNDRVMKMSSKSGDAQKVADHEKRMLKMQAAKEDERKLIVSAERKKRRAEIRRRAALRDATNDISIAEVDTTQHKWESFFDPHSARIGFDEHGRVIHCMKSSTSDHDEVQVKTQTMPGILFPPKFPADIQANGAKDGTLRGRLTAGKPVPTKQGSSITSPWQIHHASLPAEASTSAPLPLGPSSMTDKVVESVFEAIPGSYPEPVPVVAGPSSLSGWTTRKSVGASKLAQLESAPYLPHAPAPDPSPPDPSFLSFSTKKFMKKQRLMNSKKEHSLSETSKSVEADCPTSPMLTPRMTLPKEIQQRLTEAEEDLPSTPRPHPLSARLKRSGLTTACTPDATATPRATLQRLAPGGMMAASSSEMGEETLWQRAQRLGKLPSGQAALPAAIEQSEGAGWSPQVRQRGYHSMSSPQVKPSPLGGALAAEEAEGSLWERTMKGKVQASLASMGISTPNMAQSAEVADSETPWERVMRLGAQAVNPSTCLMSPKTAPSSIPEEESPWEIMQRKKNQKGHALNSKGTMHLPTSASPPDETPWQRMQRLKSQGNDQASETIEPTNNLVPVVEETPWQRITRLKAQGVDTASPTGFPPTTRSLSGKEARGIPAENEHSVAMDGMDLFCSPNHAKGGPKRQSAWGSSSQTQARSAQRDAKLKKGDSAATRRVTIEDVPDEDGPNGPNRRVGPDARLPPDSRIILDIAEPKPSVPPTMFENIFQYGENVEEGEEDEYDTGLSSSVPTPSTAPTSPPSDDALDEEWYVSAMEEMGKGNWDKLLKTGGPSVQTVGTASQQTQLHPGPQPPRWVLPTASHTKGGSLLSQTLDGAKLISALEAVDEKPATSVRACPPEPVTMVERKPAGQPQVASNNKKEPAAKPAPAPPAAKGKGKKGKGRR